MVERRPEKAGVASSILAPGTIDSTTYKPSKRSLRSKTFQFRHGGSLSQAVFARVWLLLAALAVLFAGIASAQEQPRTFRVPFRAARLLLIQATVAGRTGEFILDTGAEETLVDRSFLGLKKSQAQLSGGLAMSAALADVKDFCIGGKCFGKTRVRLMDFDKISAEMGSPVCGMIGQDLLQKFDAVTINYKTQVVELETK